MNSPEKCGDFFGFDTAALILLSEWQSNAYSHPAREWGKIQKARNTLEAYHVTDDASEQWSRNAQEEPHHEKRAARGCSTSDFEKGPNRFESLRPGTRLRPYSIQNRASL